MSRTQLNWFIDVTFLSYTIIIIINLQSFYWLQQRHYFFEDEWRRLSIHLAMNDYVKWHMKNEKTLMMKLRTIYKVATCSIARDIFRFLLKGSKSSTFCKALQNCKLHETVGIHFHAFFGRVLSEKSFSCVQQDMKQIWQWLCAVEHFTSLIG